MVRKAYNKILVYILFSIILVFVGCNTIDNSNMSIVENATDTSNNSAMSEENIIDTLDNNSMENEDIVIESEEESLKVDELYHVLEVFGSYKSDVFLTRCEVIEGDSEYTYVIVDEDLNVVKDIGNSYYNISDFYNNICVSGEDRNITIIDSKGNNVTSKYILSGETIIGYTIDSDDNILVWTMIEESPSWDEYDIYIRAKDHNGNTIVEYSKTEFDNCGDYYYYSYSDEKFIDKTYIRYIGDDKYRLYVEGNASSPSYVFGLEDGYIKCFGYGDKIVAHEGKIYRMTSNHGYCEDLLGNELWSASVGYSYPLSTITMDGICIFGDYNMYSFYDSNGNKFAEIDDNNFTTYDYIRGFCYNCPYTVLNLVGADRCYYYTVLSITGEMQFEPQSGKIDDGEIETRVQMTLLRDCDMFYKDGNLYDLNGNMAREINSYGMNIFNNQFIYLSLVDGKIYFDDFEN